MWNIDIIRKVVLSLTQLPPMTSNMMRSYASTPHKGGRTNPDLHNAMQAGRATAYQTPHHPLLDEVPEVDEDNNILRKEADTLNKRQYISIMGLDHLLSLVIRKDKAGTITLPRGYSNRTLHEVSSVIKKMEIDGYRIRDPIDMTLQFITIPPIVPANKQERSLLLHALVKGNASTLPEYLKHKLTTLQDELGGRPIELGSLISIQQLHRPRTRPIRSELKCSMEEALYIPHILSSRYIAANATISSSNLEFNNKLAQAYDYLWYLTRNSDNRPAALTQMLQDSFWNGSPLDSFLLDNVPQSTGVIARLLSLGEPIFDEVIPWEGVSYGLQEGEMIEISSGKTRGITFIGEGRFYVSARESTAVCHLAFGEIKEITVFTRNPDLRPILAAIILLTGIVPSDNMYKDWIKLSRETIPIIGNKEKGEGFLGGVFNKFEHDSAIKTDHSIGQFYSKKIRGYVDNQGVAHIYDGDRSFPLIAYNTKPPTGFDFDSVRPNNEARALCKAIESVAQLYQNPWDKSQPGLDIMLDSMAVYMKDFDRNARASIQKLSQMDLNKGQRWIIAIAEKATKNMALTTTPDTNFSCLIGNNLGFFSYFDSNQSATLKGYNNAVIICNNKANIVLETTPSTGQQYLSRLLVRAEANKRKRWLQMDDSSDENSESESNKRFKVDLSDDDTDVDQLWNQMLTDD